MESPQDAVDFLPCSFRSCEDVDVAYLPLLLSCLIRLLYTGCFCSLKVLYVPVKHLVDLRMILSNDFRRADSRPVKMLMLRLFPFSVSHRSREPQQTLRVCTWHKTILPLKTASSSCTLFSKPLHKPC